MKKKKNEDEKISFLFEAGKIQEIQIYKFLFYYISKMNHVDRNRINNFIYR